MSGSVRAMIFDFDGLLMDTESTNIASWEREWARWGLALDRETFFVLHGGDVTERRYELLARAVGPSYDRQVSHSRRVRDRDKLNAALLLASGIEQWVSEAAALGLRTTVASCSDVAWVERHLRQVDALGLFELVVGGDLVAAHKPAPDVYQLALSRLGLSPWEAVAVEDTAHGVDAAHAAGLACIAIPNPFVDVSRVSHAELTLRSATACSLAEALRRVRATELAVDPPGPTRSRA